MADAETAQKPELADQQPGGLWRCPYLGLQADQASTFLVPTEAHRCYVSKRPKAIGLEHQSAFCLTGRYPQCPLFVAPSGQGVPRDGEPPTEIPRWLRALALTFALIVAGLAITRIYQAQVQRQPPALASPGSSAPEPATLSPIAPTSTNTAVASETASTTPRPANIQAPAATVLPPTLLATQSLAVVPVTPPEPTVVSKPVAVPVSDFSFIYVRSGPGRNYPTVGTIPTGMQVDIIGRSADWWNVCCVNGTAAWVEAGLVNVSGSTDQVPTVSTPAAK